jgi:hypothetical protein
LHGRYRSPKELPRNAKNPGETRVFERRGQDSNYGNGWGVIRGGVMSSDHDSGLKCRNDALKKLNPKGDD